MNKKLKTGLTLTAAAITLILLYLPGGGDAANSQNKSTALIMNHAAHYKMGIACAHCHQPSEDQTGLMNFPDHQTCSQCHDTQESENCAQCHRRNNFEPKLRKTRIYEGTLFNHQTHQAALPPASSANEDHCLQCHAGVAKSSQLRANEGLPNMTACIDCHAAKGISKKEDCSFCHPDNLTRQKPPSHGTWWPALHGRQIQSDIALENSCRVCHNDKAAADCNTCHQKEAPESHTLAFKLRAHSIDAARYGQTCAVCHDQNTCVDCHSQTRPISHTSIYGTPINRHCNQCHLTQGTWQAMGGTKNNCSFCHDMARANSKHLEAPKMPAFGHATSNCVDCHKSSAYPAVTQLRHPVTGNDATCMACHK